MSPKRRFPEEVIAANKRARRVDDMNDQHGAAGITQWRQANKRARRVDDLYEQHGAAWITQWRQEMEEKRIAEASSGV